MLISLDFLMTDSVYADFKTFIDPAKFNYDKACETILDRLREAAKIEGYMTDSLDAQFDIIASMMKHPLDKDLDTHRPAIEPYLEKEIAGRYFFRRGEIISSLRHDPAIKEAIKVLDNPAEYCRLLTPGSAK